MNGPSRSRGASRRSYWLCRPRGSGSALGNSGRPRARLATGRYLWRDLEYHRLKDLGRPEQIFQLQGKGLEFEFPSLRWLDNPGAKRTICLHDLRLLWGLPSSWPRSKVSSSPPGSSPAPVPGAWARPDFVFRWPPTFSTGRGTGCGSSGSLPPGCWRLSHRSGARDQEPGRTARLRDPA